MDIGCTVLVRWRTDPAGGRDLDSARDSLSNLTNNARVMRSNLYQICRFPKIIRNAYRTKRMIPYL